MRKHTAGSRLDRTTAAGLPCGPRGMVRVAVAGSGVPIDAGREVGVAAVRSDAFWLRRGLFKN